MLTSRERLLRCLRHQPIDRVPISLYDLVGWNEASWQYKDESYNKVMEYIREYTDCIFMKYPNKVYKENDSLEIHEWDEAGSCLTSRVYHTSGGKLETLHRIDKGINTTWTLKHMLNDIEDIEKYLSLPYEPPVIDLSSVYREQEKLGDKGLMMLTVPDPVCLAAELFEMSDFLVYAVTEQKKIKYFLDAIHERQMIDLRNILKHDVRDMLFRVIGPEYASVPYLSPKYFNEYVTGYLKDICREIKYAGGIPRIHSHGNLKDIIDQFALTDAEAIDPIEPPPDGDMELSEVKKLYGNKFCLFGNIELRELESADRDRIDFLVKKSMDEAKEGSGFILLPTATPLNSPLSKKTEENIIQMIESGLKYGVYL